MANFNGYRDIYIYIYIKLPEGMYYIHAQERSAPVTGGHVANHGRLGRRRGTALVAHHSGLRASGWGLNGRGDGDGNMVVL